MKWVFKIITYLIVNALGFACIAVTFHIAQQQGVFSQTTDASIVTAYFQNALMAWIAGAIISVGYFVTKAPLKYVLLMAPIIGVISYSLKFAFFSSTGI